VAYHHHLLAPEQIRLVHRVYNALIREQWFPRTRRNCDECARLVIQLYQRGIDDEFELMEETRAAARNRFASSAATEGDTARVPLQTSNGSNYGRAL
jgi:hypothetical protein